MPLNNRRLGGEAARRAGVLVGVAVLCATPALAQRDTVVVAGPQYARSWLHRIFFGNSYRDIWATPIRAPILDLERFAGGLRPTGQGGGMQTLSLRFRGADGFTYRFRSVDKDPDLLPDELDGTFLDDIIRDMTSAQHPGSALISGPLLQAAGVLHARNTLFVMPDSPLLGEFRERFAGRLGYLERRPEAGDRASGFERARDIEDSDEVFPRLRRSPDDRIDARALLTARLVDLLMGDWDRHRGNWEWARVTDGRVRLWAPVPEDRDHAFVRFDGILSAVARNTSTPQLVEFGNRYSSLDGTAWNGRDIDRWFLGSIGGAEWDSIARAVQARLTDSVIEASVAALPDAWRALDGKRLARALRTRRDNLPGHARRFYRHLFSEAEVHLTAAPELVTVDRRADGSLLVTASTGGAEPHFSRIYLPRETREVRLHLRHGADTVAVRGDGPARITVRVISDDAVIDDGSRARGVLRYPADWKPLPASIRAEKADSAKPDTTELEPPGPRDYGDRTRPVLWIGGGPDVGVFLGGGASRMKWGFRKSPWHSQWTLRAGWATQARTGRLSLDGVVRRTNSRVRTEVEGWASGIEVMRWHGTGNETVAGSGSYNRVNRSEIGVAGRMVWPLARHMEISAGPQLLWADTREHAGRIIEDSLPYGVDEFGTAGVRAEIAFDSRDYVTAPTRGVAFNLGAAAWPAVWSATKSFSEVHGSASTYLTARGVPGQPTLALRAGGKKVFGRYPFAEAAFIGDASTVRLGRQNRFGGDAAAWGGAELRVALTRFDIILPGRFGVHGLADAGRVFVRGERSTQWHSAVGGGVWFSLVQPKNVVAITITKSRERTGVYVGAGFAY